MSKIHNIWCEDCCKKINKFDSDRCHDCNRLFCKYCVGFLDLHYSSDEINWIFYCHKCMPTCAHPDCNETPFTRCRNCERFEEWENNRYCLKHYAEKGLCVLCYNDPDAYQEDKNMTPFVTNNENDEIIICSNCSHSMEYETVCSHFDMNIQNGEYICKYCSFISNDYYDEVGCDKCDIHLHCICECGEFAVFNCETCGDYEKYCKNCHSSGYCKKHQ